MIPFWWACWTPSQIFAVIASLSGVVAAARSHQSRRVTPWISSIAKYGCGPWPASAVPAS
jgi:hypothetical protein